MVGLAVIGYQQGSLLFVHQLYCLLLTISQKAERGICCRVRSKRVHSHCNVVRPVPPLAALLSGLVGSPSTQ
jgi:hypothetical protein